MEIVKNILYPFSHNNNIINNNNNSIIDKVRFKINFCRFSFIFLNIINYEYNIT